MEVPAAHDSVPPSVGQEGQQVQAVGGASGAGAGPSSRLNLGSAALAVNDAKDTTIKSQAAAMKDQTTSASALAPSASTSRIKEAAPSLLLLLPQEMQELVASKVVGKTALRSTCRSMRLAVNACTSKLTWSGGPNGGAPPIVTLQLALPAAPLALQLLDCSGQHGKLLRIHSLVGCPPTVHTLICSHTLVSDLHPLGACKLLRTLDCSYTDVAELGPLAAYTLLNE